MMAGMPERTEGDGPTDDEARGALPSGLVDRLPPPSDSPAAALLQAAGELFSTHSPSDVSLRQVAELAGVNYGLIHRHFGTKEALLVELFRAYTRYGGDLITEAGSAEDALRDIFEADAGNFPALLAWVALDGSDPQAVFGDTSAVDRLRALIEAHWADPGQAPLGGDRPVDPRVATGVAVLLIMVWDLYAPYIRVLADVDDLDGGDVDRQVLELVLRMVQAAGPSGGARP